LTDVVRQSVATRSEGESKALKAEITNLRDDLRAASTDSLSKAIQGLHDQLQKANTESLKAEITALREDLAQKTVAASAANTEALQTQMAKMQEMLEKGGGRGGGMGAADLSELVSKIEGSMSKKLADAGLMKQEVSAEEAISVGSVMVNSAFRGMEDVESNLDQMDAKKQKDKDGGVKAKGALAALKKLKGG
ncbi:MAG: hypothetical protein IT463_12110, partial [Planctomycetes bacterium]|nr:hypothetical protein [Planctomycetota bacterium]